MKSSSKRSQIRLLRLTVNAVGTTILIIAIVTAEIIAIVRANPSVALQRAATKALTEKDSAIGFLLSNSTDPDDDVLRALVNSNHGRTSNTKSPTFVITRGTGTTWSPNTNTITVTDDDIDENYEEENEDFGDEIDYVERHRHKHRQITRSHSRYERAGLITTKTRHGQSMIYKSSLWDQIKDDFNFKGFGISVYKALLDFRGGGISFRLPLLANFDWWDSRPYLPSLNLIAAMYIFPLRFSVCVSTSMPVEGVRTYVYKCILIIYEFTMRFIHHMLSSLWTMWSLLAYPWTQKWDTLPVRYCLENARVAQRARRSIKIRYSSDVMERLGCTHWWRWSPFLGGFDTRTSYWHAYMPRLVPVLEQLHELLMKTKATNDEVSRDTHADGSVPPLDSSIIKKWLCSSPLMGSFFGLDTAVPNPLPPNFSLTGIFSMSGLGCHTSQGSRESKVPPQQLSRIIEGSLNDAGKIVPLTITLNQPQNITASVDDNSVSDTDVVMFRKKTKKRNKYSRKTRTAKVARGGEGWGDDETFNGFLGKE